MSIAFILGEYPSVTEGFIRNEIIELRKRGIQIVILAVRKGAGTNAGSEVIYHRDAAARDKIRAHLYCISRYGNSYFRTLSGVLFSARPPVIRLARDLKNLSESVYFLFRLRKTACTHLHAHFLSQPASIAMMMSQISGLKFSCSAHAHDIYTSPVSDIKKKLELSLFTITCTRFNKDFLSKLLNANKEVHHIYHGIDLSKWPQKRFGPIPSAVTELQILSVGRLVEKKGIIYLLKAVSELRKRGVKIRCTIVGEGPMFHLLNSFISDNHLENEISLAGALHPDFVAPLYETADVFVLPCIETDNGDKDGLPNVLLEALATGIPVITTPVSAIPELIEHELTGLLVPEKDHLGIADAITQLKTKPELYGRLVSNGRKRVEQFDIKVSTDQLCKVFKGMHEADSKIRILYGLEAADAGALKHLVYLVTHLNKDMFDITVILSPKRSGRVNSDMEKMRKHGATVISLPMERSIHPLKDTLAFCRICAHIFRSKYDIIHAHSSKAGVLFRVAAWLRGGVVSLYTPHCFYFQSKKGFTRKLFCWLERLMGRITTRLIVSNNETFSAIHNNIIPPGKIININNAISFDDYHQKAEPGEIKRKLNIPLKNTVVGAIGRLTGQKDWITYIQAAYETVKKHQDITFLIVGEGELQNDLKHLINKLGLEDHILTTGHIDNISEIYSVMDIFVSTSLWEGLPYVILEAMWFKKPIVASNLGYEGVLYNRENSLLVSHGSPHETAAAIISLLNDKELAKEMGEKSHRLIRSHFGFENFIKLHEQLYRSLVNRLQ